jgi:PAS domain S-box-containing protein
MTDPSITNQELLEEISDLKRKIMELEQLASEHKLAEDALRESEKRFRQLVELLPETVFETNMHGDLTFVNRKAFDRFGYTQEDFAGGGLNALEMIIPFDRNRAFESIQRVMNREDIISNEYTMLRKDGSTFPAIIYSTIILHEGKPAGLRGLIVDIAERKRTEKALLESKVLLDATQQMTKTGGWEWDVEQHTMTWTDETYRIHDFTSGEIAPGSPEHIRCSIDCYDLDDRPVIEAAFRRCAEQGQPYDLELPFTTKDKRRLWIRTAARPVFEGERVVRVIGNISDITDRKKTEESLRESEEKYRLTFNTSPDSVNINRLEDGLYVDINDGFTKLTGFTREDVIGRTSIEINIWDNPADRQKLIQGLREKGYYENLEAQFRKKDGSIATGLMSARIISLNGIPHIISITRDISEYRKIEKEKQGLQERLQRSEKMEALGILAGGVAHDLNNVLGIVVGYSEILLMGVDKSSPIRSKLVNIMEGGQKAAAIVQDMLTLARRGVSGRDVVNLNKIIADCLKSPEFKNLSSYHSAIGIRTELEPDLQNISGSSVHLGKTIFNLVSNASEAMLKGGVLTIKTANQYLDKPIQGYDEIQEGDYVVFSVSDTGEGINADDMKRIFEPFYTKKVMGRSGTGLGLAVVWGTVKDHNGYINVESKEGKGSVFSLYFPVTREELSAGHLTVSISEYMGKGESILIVDDVKGQRELADEMLRKLNYTVATASSGEEAIAYLKEHKIDLMVLDMIMDPGMDGLDTYKKVLVIHPKQKAIIVSGFSESDRVKAAQALGAGAYVRKPYVIEKLGLAVKKELNRAV